MTNPACKIKPPKVLAIHPPPQSPFNPVNSRFKVVITRKQTEKLPTWIANMHLKFFLLDNNRHAYTAIYAKDELQALTRFNALWVLLMQLEEK